MQNKDEKHKLIKGWGADIDTKNEPTYPIKKNTDDDHKRLNYVRPPLQQKTVEVLHSNERPSVSAVFGTSVPPSGLSGMIRRFAFRYSESSFGHWFPLIFADRVNVWEGIIHDFGRGKLPNIWAEKGVKADWKYNKPEYIAKTTAKIVFTLVFLSFMMSGSRKKKRKR
jgi:hypothetical protein